MSISTGNHKEAALYFDKLIPTHSNRNVPDSLIEPVRFEDYKLAELFAALAVEPAESDHLATIRDAALRHVWREAPMSVRYSKDYVENVFPGIVKSAQERWADRKYVTSLVLHSGQVDEGHFLVPAFDSAAREQDFATSGNDEVVQVTLNNLELVDASRLEWQQILELKKDRDSDRKFRNLLLFLYRNYGNQPVGFVRDDMMRQIDEYHQTCRKFGFKLVTSTLSTVLNSKSLLATIGLGTLALLSGLPIAALTPAAICAAALEVGKIAINYTEQKRDLADYKETHPLSYILQLPLHDSL